jgi:hypothetical protein
MPEHKISDIQATSVRPFGFLLQKDDLSYALEFESDFLADNDVPAILHALAVISHKPGAKEIGRME